MLPDHDAASPDHRNRLAGTEPWRPAPLLLGSGALHLGALGALALAPPLWPWVAAGLVSNHLLLVAAGLVPGSRLLGPVLTRLPADADGGPAVALTFDDGPDPETTPRVLESLAAAGVRATFFCVGERAARHPSLVREMAAVGHRVENHTWSHRPDFALTGMRSQAREIDRTQSLLADLSGRAPAYVRTPAGLRNLLLAPLLHRRGLRLAAWTRRGFDKVDGDPVRVFDRLTRRVRTGDILLLHDGWPARGKAGEPVTLEVLPRLLEGLAAEGLGCQPLPEPGGNPTR